MCPTHSTFSSSLTPNFSTRFVFKLKLTPSFASFGQLDPSESDFFCKRGERQEKSKEEKARFKKMRKRTKTKRSSLIFEAPLNDARVKSNVPFALLRKTLTKRLKG